MSNSSDVSLSDSTDKVTAAHNDDRLIAQCRKVWTKYVSRGLDARYTLGALLNERLGTPAQRQKYGANVLQRAAKELQIAKSELTRMKQFADRFPSVVAFREQHPGCDTWHQVKQLLTASASKDDAPQRTREKSPVRGIMRTLERATTLLRNGGLPVAGAEAEALRKTLRELTEVANSYLQV